MGVSYTEIDAITRSRCGELTAYGLLETQIADVILISVEQVIAIKESPEFKAAHSRVLKEKTQRAIDLQDGWDAVEEKALESVYASLEYNRDPHFALMAARTANVAKRRVGGDVHKVIDSARAGNVVILNMNKTYINNASDGTKENTIDVSPRKTGELPKKRIDMLSPKAVTNILQPVVKDEIGDMRAEALGIAMDLAGVKIIE